MPDPKNTAKVTCLSTHKGLISITALQKLIQLTVSLVSRYGSTTAKSSTKVSRARFLKKRKTEETERKATEDLEEMVKEDLEETTEEMTELKHLKQ